MYRCESQAIKKVDAFKFQCWRRLLRVPWTARRSNQSILKEIQPEYSLKGLTLKLQYFGHLMWRANSLEKTLILGKTEAKRGRVVAEDEMVRQHHQFNGHEFEQTPGVSRGQRSLVCYSPGGHKESDMTYNRNCWVAFLGLRRAPVLYTSAQWGKVIAKKATY